MADPVTTPSSVSTSVANLANQANQTSSAGARKVSASVSGGAVSGSTVDNSGDASLFSAAQKSLGKQDFLNLLVTQLRYQDPLQPEDNTQFVAQLAQFSNLEGTQNISDNISNLSKQLTDMVNGQKTDSTAISNASATNLIGKSVRVNADSIAFDPAQGGAVDINVHTDQAGSVLSILDDQQKVVNAVPLTSSGDASLSWNGSKMDGTMAAKGTYTLKVTTPDGATDTGYTYLENTVSGLTYNNGAVRLEVGGQTVGMDQLVHVGEAPAAGQ